MIFRGIDNRNVRKHITVKCRKVAFCQFLDEFNTECFYIKKKKQKTKHHMKIKHPSSVLAVYQPLWHDI